jgi:hypothetical protein
VAVGIIAAGVLPLAACSSGSDDDTAAAAADTTESAETVAPTAASVETTPPATDPPATDPPVTEPPDSEPPATEPPATEPPTTDPPTTDPPTAAVSLPGTVVAEGTAALVAGSRIDGPAAPDGRVPTTSRTTYEGDLVGDMTLLGSYVIGAETVDALTRSEFTGELVGIGSGTFVSETATTFVKTDGSGAATGQIVSGTGVFADVVGTISLALSEFGADVTYRIELTPVDQATAEQSAPPVDAAAEIADEIATSFNARDFLPIQRRLGQNGTWIAIDGQVYDAATVTAFLDGFDFIQTIERIGEGTQGPDGIAFEISETFDGGGAGTFWLVVSYDDAGALVITELAEAPQW